MCYLLEAATLLGVKICRVCGFPKEQSDFSVNKKNRDGRDSRCKSCRSDVYESNKGSILAKAKALYQANPEQFRTRRSACYTRNKDTINAARRAKRKSDPSVRQSELKRRHEVRKQCFDALGGACKNCNISDHDVLCVDHVFDDGQAERESGVALITIWRKVICGQDPGRFQLLCFSCNLRKSILRDRIGPKIGTQKVCATCHHSFDFSHFKLDAKYGDGRYYECRRCTRNRVVALKLTAILVVGEPKCVKCSCSDALVLTFDHIHDDGHLTRTEDGLGESLYRRIIHNDVDSSRFQILCLNCNLKKHRMRIGAGLTIAGFSAMRDSSGLSSTPPDPTITEVTPQEFSFEEADVCLFTDLNSSVEFLHQHHYGGYGRYGSLHVACLVRGQIAAIAKFASPIRQEVVSSLGFAYSEVLELDRFCISPAFRKKNLASFFLSSTARIVHRERPFIKGLVSFADPEQGHTGRIYLAANWRPVPGRVRSDYVYESKDGARIHKKTVFDNAKRRGLKEFQYADQTGLKKVAILGKKKFFLSF